MPSGSSMNIMMKEMPERAIDVGIAEQHAVTFSAGLATQGLIPFCNIYSTFMQRAYDQVIHDVCIQNLPVNFCLDRAGFAGADGPTHHGAYDIALLPLYSKHDSICSNERVGAKEPHVYCAAAENGESILDSLSTWSGCDAQLENTDGGDQDRLRSEDQGW